MTQRFYHCNAIVIIIVVANMKDCLYHHHRVFHCYHNCHQKTHSFHLDVIGVMMTKLICSASSPVTIQLTCPGPPLLGEYHSLMSEYSE